MYIFVALDTPLHLLYGSPHMLIQSLSSLHDAVIISDSKMHFTDHASVCFLFQYKILIFHVMYFHVSYLSVHLQVSVCFLLTYNKLIFHMMYFHVSYLSVHLQVSLCFSLP